MKRLKKNPSNNLQITGNFTVFFKLTEDERTDARSHIKEIIAWGESALGKFVHEWAIDTGLGRLYFKTESDATAFKLRWGHLFKIG